MKTVLISLITFFSIGLIGCSDIQTNPTEPTPLYVTSNSDGTYETSQPIETPRKPDNRKPTTPPTIFGDLLVKLNLTPEQKPVVERLLVEHRTCVEACVQGLKNAEREILMNARLQEAAIKTKVKNGELTKEQGHQQLRQLREETQIKLKALPKERVRECVKSCDTTFIQQLREILTPEQKLILEKWIASREKRGTTDNKKPGGRG